jgi:hypothetical protein
MADALDGFAPSLHRAFAHLGKGRRWLHALVRFHRRTRIEPRRVVAPTLFGGRLISLALGVLRQPLAITDSAADLAARDCVFRTVRQLVFGGFASSQGELRQKKLHRFGQGFDFLLAASRAVDWRWRAGTTQALGWDASSPLPRNLTIRRCSISNSSAAEEPRRASARAMASASLSACTTIAGARRRPHWSNRASRYEAIGGLPFQRKIPLRSLRPAPSETTYRDC